MNRFFVFFALFAAVSLVSAAAQSTPAAELSFSFTRQKGMSSNQFAVWVENSQGNLVKTLYATRYTANGGWKKRENSIPLWVKQSGLAGMTKTQIDSITGATPKTGTLVYRWDGTDSKNAALPSGDYVICLEATLRGDNQVRYRAPIRLGQGQASPAVNVEYIGRPGAEQGMINAVAAKTLR